MLGALDRGDQEDRLGLLLSTEDGLNQVNLLHNNLMPEA
jgi:hypothetical protein